MFGLFKQKPKPVEPDYATIYIADPSLLGSKVFDTVPGILSYEGMSDESGNATLSLVVADVNGIDGSSQLAIHQISQTPAVPEPATWLLLLGGLGLMGFMQRNKV